MLGNINLYLKGLMSNPQTTSKLVRWYRHFYSAFLKYKVDGLLCYLNNQVPPKDEERYQLLILVMAVFVTSILMWSYALNTFFTIQNIYGLKYLCFVYSLIHLFSPLLYKLKKSIPLCAHVFIAAGFAFQFHHSLATGGFNSNTIIWFSILPLIIGIVARRMDLFIWMALALLAVLAQAYLTKIGFVVNGFHTSLGPIWAQYNISLGYIMINCVLILLYIKARDHHKQKMDEKNAKIRNLIRLLSHDINNPLFFLKTNVVMLQRLSSDNNESQKKYLNNLNLGIDAIKQIVNSVRQLELYEISEKQLELEAVDLMSVIDDSTSIFREQLEQKKLRIEKHYGPLQKEKILIKANKSTFQFQIICNLLSNAIKFSPVGGTIGFQIEDLGENVELSIKDSGIGMGQEIIDKLFNFDLSTTRPGTLGETGTGHGMPIVKTILDKIGGTIQIESSCPRLSAQGNGTCIKLVLAKYC